jgi:hypothetical protein
MAATRRKNTSKVTKADLETRNGALQQQLAAQTALMAQLQGK